ncbi:MAG TPA: biotin--[acetyl-CoA-carboxylase] ligase [Microbacteriaceae bacterium]|jgi:BirA family biotin operon repressor/biotin-[acetyl-CoA-carboxylase] ligase|nr:biotin--[acetyl-CoA-carboxylase] ligase [Microbacteriaceae bacterium]HQX36311.1 biotin--[acetyl-CoA-carboxylase] ligase [Microbacteriaceae bacterium]HQZ48673.1 biotin--[acetyl-CoA-carboxylase] ligase [Microbacteriaceae bacterium]HRA09991.1 biotin--[acetyl-CoA-carboxylase] ligase [Microbacteriaceae bacterium]
MDATTTTFAHCLDFAPRLLNLESTGSTNADLVAEVRADPEEWPEGSVLLTQDQRAGRGRLDREWTTPPGSALAASVVVDAEGVPADARGWLPLIAGVAMTRAVTRAVRGTGHKVSLKWPNDVLVDGQKISGILAEMVTGSERDAIVVGVGVNTAMTVEQLPVDTATSFAALGIDADVDLLLVAYLFTISERWDALRATQGNPFTAGVHHEVVAVCGTIGTEVLVHLPGGDELRGEAFGIDEFGRLQVRTADGTETVVSAGDVVHVR